MKALKILTMVMFSIGFMLMAGAIGTDDFYVLQLHQPHSFQWLQAVIGMMLCLPVLIIDKVKQ